MQEASRAAAHGHFSEAAATLFAGPGLNRKTSRRRGYNGGRRSTSRRRAQQALAHDAEEKRREAELHAALGRQDWGAVLSSAEAVLAIAPQHEAARQARRTGVEGGRDGRDASRRLRRLVGTGVAEAGSRGQCRRTAVRLGKKPTSGEAEAVSGDDHPQNGLLWVDAVGGFLVCLDDQVVLGQPSSGQAIAVPILADLVAAACSDPPRWQARIF